MVRIGKKAFAWNSSKFRMHLFSSVGLRSLDFGDKINDELVYGMRRDGTPDRVTAGEYEPAIATAKFLWDDWYGTGNDPTKFGMSKKLLSSAGALGTLGLSDIEFDMQFQGFEELVGTVTLNFPVCRFIEIKDSPARGTGPLDVDIGIRVIGAITRNGVTLASQLRALSL